MTLGMDGGARKPPAQGVNENRCRKLTGAAALRWPETKPFPLKIHHAARLVLLTGLRVC